MFYISKGWKRAMAVSGVIFFISVVLLIVSRLLRTEIPSGSVLTPEYIHALKNIYLSENLKYAAGFSSAISLAFIIGVITTHIRYGSVGKRMMISYICGLAMFISLEAYLCPNIVRVAFAEPVASEERILAKGEVYELGELERPAFEFMEGKAAVDDTMYMIYDAGDTVILVSCGGVPLEVFQPEVFSIGDEAEPEPERDPEEIIESYEARNREY